MNVIDHEYKTNRKFSERKITTEIILHCSATPEGKDFSVNDIDRWHKERNFSCIGYHFVIYRNGDIHQGRPINTVGAHAGSEHNPKSVGVCYIGGLTKDGKTAKDTRTEEQKTAMYELVNWLKKRYDLANEDIHGHYEFAAKSCPSFKTEAFIKELKEWYKSRAAKDSTCDVKDWF